MYCLNNSGSSRIQEFAYSTGTFGYHCCMCMLNKTIKIQSNLRYTVEGDGMLLVT